MPNRASERNFEISTPSTKENPKNINSWLKEKTGSKVTIYTKDGSAIETTIIGIVDINGPSVSFKVNNKTNSLPITDIDVEKTILTEK
jgi:hypothetical protein